MWKGGEIFGDDEILVSNFRFLPKYLGVQNSPPSNGSYAVAQLSQISAGTCSFALQCALDGLLQPVLLDSAS